jgi:hypothetical protein
MDTILNFLFGCSHRRTTFPQTAARHTSRTYVVCLDCGQEFRYDWMTMRRGEAVSERVQPADLPSPAVQASSLRRRSVA